MDYQSLLYDPVYSTFGVAAVLHMGGAIGDVPVTAIDETQGVAVNLSVDVQTLSPAATVRMSELTAATVDPDAIDDATITLNGIVWRITSHRMQPSPNGQADGEVYLLLERI